MGRKRKKQEHSPEKWQEAREKYEQGCSLRLIAESTGISKSTIEGRIKSKGWERKPDNIIPLKARTRTRKTKEEKPKPDTKPDSVQGVRNDIDDTSAVDGLEELIKVSILSMSDDVRKHPDRYARALEALSKLREKQGKDKKDDIEKWTDIVFLDEPDEGTG